MAEVRDYLGRIASATEITRDQLKGLLMVDVKKMPIKSETTEMSPKKLDEVKVALEELSKILRADIKKEIELLTTVIKQATAETKKNYERNTKERATGDKATIKGAAASGEIDVKNLTVTIDKLEVKFASPQLKARADKIVKIEDIKQLDVMINSLNIKYKEPQIIANADKIVKIEDIKQLDVTIDALNVKYKQKSVGVSAKNLIEVEDIDVLEVTVKALALKGTPDTSAVQKSINKSLNAAATSTPGTMPGGTPAKGGMPTAKAKGGCIDVCDWKAYRFFGQMLKLLRSGKGGSGGGGPSGGGGGGTGGTGGRGGKGGGGGSKTTTTTTTKEKETDNPWEHLLDDARLVPKTLRGWETRLRQVRDHFDALSETIADINISKQLGIQAVLGQVFKYNREMRSTLFITQGISGENKEMQDAWSILNQKESLVAVTGQDMTTNMQVQQKLMGRGIKDRNSVMRIMKTSGNFATMMDVKAEDAAEMFGTWSTQLGMSATQIQSMSRGMQSIARHTGLSGQNIMEAAKSSEGLLKALRQSGNLTGDAAKNVIGMMASFKKAGVEEMGQAIMGAMSGPQGFLKAAPGIQALLAQSAAAMGKSIAELPDILKDKGMMKTFGANFKNQIKGIFGTLDFKNMNAQQRFQANITAESMGLGGIGDIERALGAMDEATMTFTDRIRTSGQKISEIEAKRIAQGGTLTKVQQGELKALQNQQKTLKSGRLQDFGSELRNLTDQGYSFGEAVNRMTANMSAQDSADMRALGVSGPQEALNAMVTDMRGQLDNNMKKTFASMGMDKEFDELRDKLDPARIQQALQDAAGDPEKMGKVWDEVEDAQKTLAMAQKAATDPTVAFQMRLKILNEALGKLINRAINPLLDAIQDLVNWLKALGPEGEWFADNLLNIGIGIVGLTGALGTLSVVAGALKSIFGLFVGAIRVPLNYIMRIPSLFGSLFGAVEAGTEAVATSSSLLARTFGFLGRMLGRVVPLIGPAIMGIVGASEAADNNRGTTEGAILGALTGGAGTGSMFSGMLGFEKGSEADEATGIGTAAGAGALTGGVIGSIIPGIGTGIGAAIGALFGAGGEIYKLMTTEGSELGGQFKEFFKPLIDVLEQAKPIFDRAVDSLNNLWNMAVEKLNPAWKQIKDSLNNLWMKLQPLIPVLTDVAYWFGIVAGALLGILAIGGVAAAIQVFVIIIDVATAVITGIIDIISGLVEALMGVWHILEGFINFLVGLVAIIIGIFTLDSSMISAGWESVKSGIKTFLWGIWEVIVGVVKAIYAAVKAIVVSLWGIIEGIVGWFAWLYDVLVGHSVVTDICEGIFKAFLSLFTTLPGLFLTGLGIILTTIGEWFGGSTGDWLTWLGEWATVIGDWFLGLPSDITDWLADWMTTISDWFGDMPSDFANWLDDVMTEMVSWAGGLGSAIVGALTGVAGQIADALNPVNMISNVASSADSAAREIPVVGGAYGAVSDAASSAVGAVGRNMPWNWFEEGTNKVTKEGMAMIHAGETIVPADTPVAEGSGPYKEGDMFGKLVDAQDTNTEKIVTAINDLNNTFKSVVAIIAQTVEGISSAISGVTSGIGGIFGSIGSMLQPRGTDNVPAMLTPGEFVVNNGATQKNRGLLEQINAGGPAYMAAGGVVSPTTQQAIGTSLNTNALLEARQDQIAQQLFADATRRPEGREPNADERNMLATYAQKPSLVRPALLALPLNANKDRRIKALTDPPPSIPGEVAKKAKLDERWTAANKDAKISDATNVIRNELAAGAGNAIWNRTGAGGDIEQEMRLGIEQAALSLNPSADSTAAQKAMPLTGLGGADKGIYDSIATLKDVEERRVRAEQQMGTLRGAVLSARGRGLTGKGDDVKRAQVDYFNALRGMAIVRRAIYARGDLTENGVTRSLTPTVEDTRRGMEARAIDLKNRVSPTDLEFNITKAMQEMQKPQNQAAISQIIAQELVGSSGIDHLKSKISGKIPTSRTDLQTAMASLAGGSGSYLNVAQMADKNAQLVSALQRVSEPGFRPDQQLGGTGRAVYGNDLDTNIQQAIATLPQDVQTAFNGEAAQYSLNGRNFDNPKQIAAPWISGIQPTDKAPTSVVEPIVMTARNKENITRRAAESAVDAINQVAPGADMAATRATALEKLVEAGAAQKATLALKASDPYKKSDYAAKEATRMSYLTDYQRQLLERSDRGDFTTIQGEAGTGRAAVQIPPTIQDQALINEISKATSSLDTNRPDIGDVTSFAIPRDQQTLMEGRSFDHILFRNSDGTALREQRNGANSTWSRWQNGNWAVKNSLREALQRPAEPEIPAGQMQPLGAYGQVDPYTEAALAAQPPTPVEIPRVPRPPILRPPGAGPVREVARPPGGRINIGDAATFGDNQATLNERTQQAFTRRNLLGTGSDAQTIAGSTQIQTALQQRGDDGGPPTIDERSQRAFASRNLLDNSSSEIQAALQQRGGDDRVRQMRANDGVMRDYVNTGTTQVPQWRPIDTNMVNIPELATGGIVTRPTVAMIGEAGAEAVMPLDSPQAQTVLPHSNYDMHQAVMQERYTSQKESQQIESSDLETMADEATKQTDLLKEVKETLAAIEKKMGEAKNKPVGNVEPASVRQMLSPNMEDGADDAEWPTEYNQ